MTESFKFWGLGFTALGVEAACPDLAKRGFGDPDSSTRVCLVESELILPYYAAASFKSLSHFLFMYAYPLPRMISSARMDLRLRPRACVFALVNLLLPLRTEASWRTVCPVFARACELGITLFPLLNAAGLLRLSIII